MRNQLKILLLILCVGGLAFSLSLVSSAQRRHINFKAPGRGVAPGDYKRTITVGGRVRSYLLHLPPSPNRGKPMPVVIVLHGGGGNAEVIAQTSGFTAKADEERFIVIYPNGTGRPRNRLLTWNSGNCCGYAHENNVDDVSFVRSLIEQVQQELNVDSRRIFVTGFSNGGMMSYRLACELSETIAAIAPVAGALNYEKCNPVRPVSVVAFHGTADEHVLYEGGEPIRRSDPNPRVDRSVAEAISYWVARDQCANDARKERRGSVIIEDYAKCREGTGVRLYTLEGGGHAWPGGEARASWADRPTTALKATDAMWDFFSSHPKR
jgi:polyhydroxybutyrate depolymerase